MCCKKFSHHHFANTFPLLKCIFWCHWKFYEWQECIFKGEFVIFLNSLHGLFWTNRRVILWVDSVPSPGKSRILSEIKVRLNNPTLFLTECIIFLFISVFLFIFWNVWIILAFVCLSLPPVGPSCRVRTLPSAKCYTSTLYLHGNIQTWHFHTNLSIIDEDILCISRLCVLYKR